MGAYPRNKKVIATLLTIPLNLLQVSAHIVAWLLLLQHGSTTTCRKERKMNLKEIRETWIKMTSDEECGRTFGIAAVALGIGGFLNPLPYFTIPFFCFPASVACGVTAYKHGQRRWGAAAIAIGAIGTLVLLFALVSASAQFTK